MGFLEETKVFLSTRYADHTSPGLSSATWILKTALETLNPLYKMKVKITGASIPNTFDRVSEHLQNNKLAVAYNIPGEAKPGVIKIDVKRPFHEGQEQGLLDYVNRVLLERTDELMPNTVHRPFFVMDSEKARCAMVVLDYTAATNFNTELNELIGIEEPTSLTAPISNPDAPRAFRLLTVADASSGNEYGIAPSDVGLAEVLGFVRFQSTPTVSGAGPVDDPHNVFTAYNTQTGDRFAGVTGVVRPETAIDMSGTRFVSVVMPDLSIGNISPVSLDTSRIVTCLPVTSRFEGDATPVVSSVNDAPYTTVAQDRINKITVELQDDRGRPLRMHHDWFLELSIRIEEPDATDAYRGTEDLVLPMGAFMRDPDPGRYARLNNELKRNHAMLMQTETGERADHASRTLPR